VLGGLKAKLMHPDLVKEFVAEYHREINRVAASRDSARQGLAKELATVEREIREIIGAIKSGIRSATMTKELETLENRKEELQRKLAAKPEPPIRLHPNLAEVYRRWVENLREALSREDAHEEAVAILRGLIDQIRLEPVDGELGIYLVGNLAAILGLCTKKHPGSLEAGVQTTLVAGVGFEPTTFRL
jgi:site-specific DNA recombinase